VDRVLERAAEAAEDGVRIYSYGLGLRRRWAWTPYARTARLTGGRYERLDTAGSILEELPRLDLARIAGISIENATTGDLGRAVRVFPDGSFDGLVELAPGENLLRVTARGPSGDLRSEERRVFFDRRKPRSAAEKRRLAEELARIDDELALRSLEGRLASEAIAARAEQMRVLELGPGDPRALP
jgi:hypothetical protein